MRSKGEKIISQPLARETREGALEGELLALPAPARLELDDSRLEPARTDDELPGQPDQVHLRELGPCAFVAIVVEHLDLRRRELAVDLVAGAHASGIARAQIDEPDLEGRHRLGPDDAILVMARLDDGADKAGDADAVGAHVRGVLLPLRIGDVGLKRHRVFGAEIEDMADLDAARLDALFGGDLGKGLGIVLVVGRRIKAGPVADHGLEIGLVVDAAAENVELDEVAVAIDLALAGVRENDEL